MIVPMRPGILASLTILFSGSCLWAGIGEAKGLLEQQKYKEAWDQISAEVEGEGASLDALKVAMKAAVGAGRFVDAAEAAKKAMALTKNNDLEVLAEGAQIAELVGDERTAISRHVNVMRLTSEKSEALRKSLVFLLKNGSFPDAARKYISVFGLDPTMEYLGPRLLDRLLANKEEENYAEVFFELMQASKGRGKFQETLLWKIDRAVGGKQIQNRAAGKRIFEAFRHVTITWEAARRAHDRTAGYASFIERADVLLDHIVAAKKVDWWVTNSLDYAFRSIKDGNDMRSQAEKALKVINSKPQGVHRLISEVTEHGKVFAAGDRPVVDVKKANELISAVKGTGVRTRDIIRNVNRNIMKKEADRLSFMKANIGDLSPDTFSVFNGSKNAGPVKQLLIDYAKSHPTYRVDQAKSYLLRFFADNKDNDGVMAAAEAMLKLNPGSWSTGDFQRYFLQNKDIDDNKKVTLIKSILPKTGDYGRMAGQLKEVFRRRKELNKHEGFKGLRDLVNAGGKGSDAVAHARAVLANTRINDKKVDKKLEELVAAAMKGKTKVVSADYMEVKTAEEYMMHSLWYYHNRHNMRTREGMKNVVKIWTPAFKDLGEAWASTRSHMEQSRSIGRDGIALTFLKNYASHIRSADDINDSIYAMLGGVHPKGDSSTPLARVYPYMAGRALSYVHSQRGGWAKDLYSEQMVKVLSNKAIKLTTSDLERVTGSMVWDKNRATYFTTDIANALTDRAMALAGEGDVSVNLLGHLFGLSIAAGKDTAAKAYIEKIKPVLSKLPATDSFRFVRTVSEGMRWYGNDVKASLHQVMSTAAPKMGEGDWTQIDVHYHMFYDLNDIEKAGIPGASEMKTSLSMAILRGAGTRHDANRYTGYLRSRAIDAIGKKGWVETTHSLFRLADLAVHNRDTTAEHKATYEAVVNKLVEFEAFQVAFAFLNHVSDKIRNNRSDALKLLSVLKAQVSRDIPGLISVDKDDPAYDLHMAAQSLIQGAETRAWQLTQPKLDILTEQFSNFDIQFVAWAIDQMRKQKMHREALEFSFRVLADEFSLAAEDAAKVALIKGDVYRDMQNYQAARIEYEGIKSNQRYRKTPAGEESVFRLIELLILTNDYAAAEQQLDRLVNSSSIRMQADAYYLFARISMERQEYPEAAEHLDKVFKRIDGHVRGRLLEGELKLKLPRGLANPEVEIGNPRLKTVVVPGRVLNLRLQDSNLAIARGGQAIPIVISTSGGGDEERVDLMAGAESPNLFTGTIRTSLGKAEKGNTQLEVRGDEVISYIIDPEFQKANSVEYSEKSLIVKADGRLMASAGKILSEEEMEEQLLQEKLAARGKAKAKKGRDGRTVRPGSPIYMEVIDLDRDVSEAQDHVIVTLKTSSGDEVSGVKLEETEEHSGVFRGKVETGVPFPLVTASDSSEGIDPNAVINVNRSEIWSSVADGKKPKFLEVDTMSSHAVKSAELLVPDPDVIRKVRLEASLDGGGIPVGEYPESNEEVKGGMRVKSGGAPRSKLLSALRGAFETSLPKGILPTTAYKTGDLGTQAGRAGLSVWMSGTFWNERDRELDFKILSDADQEKPDNVYLVIDGREVLGGPMRPQSVNDTRRRFLAQGAHTIEVFIVAPDGKAQVEIAVKDDVATEFTPFPAEWFSPEAFPALRSWLLPKAKITKTDRGFLAEFRSDDRFRKLRWVFEDFAGASVEVKEMRMSNREGEVVLPGKNDFTTGKTNDLLEVAGGDDIVVTYSDQLRLNEDTPELLSNLNASYFDGQVAINYEHVKEDGTLVTTAAQRVKRGDTLMIRVTDNDEDLTQEQDRVKVTVSTTSREEVTMELLETEPQSGVFTQMLQLGETTDATKNTLKLNPNDVITATFLDRENTRPSIPFERFAEVVAVEPSEFDLMVYPSFIEMQEDTSEEALANLRKIARKLKKDVEEMKIYKEVPKVDTSYLPPPGVDPATTPVKITYQAPFSMKVSWPSRALHGMSYVNVAVVAQSELDRAAAEEREPERTELRARVSSLEEGTFSATIGLDVGSLDIEEGLEEDDGKAAKKLIVSGTDMIHAFLLDAEGKDVAQRSANLLSDARVELLDRSYTAKVESIHLGQKFYLQVTDMDQNKTSEQDVILVKATSSSGDAMDIELKETLPQSGVFSSSIEPRFWEEDETTGEKKPMDQTDMNLWVNFGDTLTFSYTDPTPLTQDEPVSHSVEGKVHHGANGELASFTKRFKDPEMAVKTRFLMAEALFEIAKDYRKLKREDEADIQISKGKRILEEAMRDYPNTKLVAQGEFLLANLAQELKNYQEAIGKYTNIIAHHGDTEYAPRAQFKKALCLEKLDQYERACEEYVKLTYIYPEHRLVADATVRLGNYYYKKKLYDTAGRVFVNFSKRNNAHPLAAKAMFLGAQSFIKKENEKEDEKGRNYSKAIETLNGLIESFPDDKNIRAEAMYWLGDCQTKAADFVGAYKSFKKLTWDYPETKWAKIARGRLSEKSFSKISL